MKSLFDIKSSQRHTTAIYQTISKKLINKFYKVVILFELYIFQALYFLQVLEEDLWRLRRLSRAINYLFCFFSIHCNASPWLSDGIITSNRQKIFWKPILCLSLNTHEPWVARGKSVRDFPRILLLTGFVLRSMDSYLIREFSQYFNFWNNFGHVYHEFK